MSAPLLMICASFLFATMGVCVKLASDTYGPGEIVMYRGLVGMFGIALLARARGVSLKTRVPMMHAWRSIVGVTALTLWFYAIGHMPLATAVTLNYMSSVWMALFLIGGAIAVGAARIDGRALAAVLLGFAGVALVLRPTIDQQQLWHGLMGLLSGMFAATAYLQVTALGRAGETDDRIVFYFSLGSVGAGALTLLWTGMQPHTWAGIAELLAVGVLATVAQWMITRAYSTGRTLVNASLHYLGIAFSFAYGVLLFDDRVTPLALLGMVLIVGAGLFATVLRTRSVAHDQGTAPNES